ncbi:MAG: hypothetical protein NG784_14010 [Candidatus Jettenia sp.]|nr:hypothetical protein [Candidatus Jettenia sp.]
MPYLVRGALVEYGSDFLGPLLNAVTFQFNPESLSRAIQIPTRPTGVASREIGQTGEVPVEKITFTAHFSAADQLDKGDKTARAYGIGHQLAALEKMVHPKETVNGFVAKAVDEIGKLLSNIAGVTVTLPIPRENYPRTLFMWGQMRVLPVIIESMNITEQQYDQSLNPIQAEVSLGLNVITINSYIDDTVARGALTWSNLAKDKAIENLVNTAKQGIDIIPF